MPQCWEADEMLDILIDQAGLPREQRPATLDVTFDDIGLDSLAYIQLQAAVHGLFGVELPDSFPKEHTLSQILSDVNNLIGEREGVA